MGGKMPASYWRAYRQRNKERLNAQQRAQPARLARRADPAYRAKKNAAERERRAREGGGRGPLVLALPYTGHPLLEQARSIAGHCWYGTVLYDPLREDGASVALLALLEGAGEAEAARRVRRFYDAERFRRRREFPRWWRATDTA